MQSCMSHLAKMLFNYVAHKKAILNGDNYYENKDGLIVFTKKYLIERKRCCHKGCKHCPYETYFEKFKKSLVIAIIIPVKILVKVKDSFSK